MAGRLEGTVWNAGGCASWYLDDAGRNTTLWPTYTFPMKRMLERFDVAAYRVEPPVSAPAPREVVPA